MRRLVIVISGELAPEAASTVDVPPLQHRHSSIWMA